MHMSEYYLIISEWDRFATEFYIFHINLVVVLYDRTNMPDLYRIRYKVSGTIMYN